MSDYSCKSDFIFNASDIKLMDILYDQKRYSIKSRLLNSKSL